MKKIKWTIALLTSISISKVYIVANDRWLSKNGKLNWPVDIVYLWCDGSDPEFQKNLRKIESCVGNISPQAKSIGRFFNNDELKFSLRSLEKYAPWINHVYVVTSGQRPIWLDPNNTKITIVDVSQIVSAGALPTFNSNLIATRIHNIPNLSEHFLFADDDMFFGSEVKPVFFFDKRGNPIVRGSRLKKFSKNRKKMLIFVESEENLYVQAVLRSIYLVQNRFGDTLNFFPHHNIDAYRKSYMKDAFNVFEQEYNELARSRFREKNNIRRTIVSCVDYVKNRASFRLVRFHHDLLPRFFPFLIPMQDSLCEVITIFNSRRNELTEKIKKWIKDKRFYLFCLNDTGFATQEDRDKTREFLEELFPEKSSFELPEKIATSVVVTSAATAPMARFSREPPEVPPPEGSDPVAD
ncbi:MAG: Stealth CR1 domain-containing protein [Rickettsiales bacterium]|nr:Stealth CR1 domain-containing protein [Rickettsiales bacterium]